VGIITIILDANLATNNRCRVKYIAVVGIVCIPRPHRHILAVSVAREYDALLAKVGRDGDYARRDAIADIAK
jgi:hypothetical protein